MKRLFTFILCLCSLVFLQAGWLTIAAQTEVNFALASMGSSATASSIESDGAIADFAIDGDEWTRWASGFSDAEWFLLDLGVERRFHRIEIVWEDAYTKTFTIEVSSNGISYTPIYSIANQENPGTQVIKVNSMARYVRMNCIERGTPWGNSFYEIRVIGYDGNQESQPDPIDPEQPDDNDDNFTTANVLTFSSDSAAIGETITITASLKNHDAVVAGEVIIPLNGYCHYVPGSAVLNSQRSNGHIIYAVEADDSLRINFLSMTLVPLLDTIGDLFSFQLKLCDEPIFFAQRPILLLSDAAGQAIDSKAGACRLAILAPKIEILSSVIDYGHQPIREMYIQQLQLRNTGTLPLTISSLIMPSDRFSYDGEPRVIPAGSYESIPITYSPIQRGRYSGTMKILSDAANGALRVNSEVSLLADPYSVNELHISSASALSDEEVTIAVRINNMEPLVGAQFSFILPDALEYVEESALLASRASNHSIGVVQMGDTLTFIIYSLGNAVFVGNDGDLMTFRLRLNGTSGRYDLNPITVGLSNSSSENMISAVYGGSVEIQSPRYTGDSELTFSDCSVVGSVLQSYTIHNYGSAPLIINKVSFLTDADFRIVEQLPVVVRPRESSSITIEHTPSVEGDYSCIMQVYSNDPIHRMHTVMLSGHVYEPNTILLTGELAENDYVVHVSLANYSNVVGLQMDFHWLDGLMAELTPTSRLAALNTTLIPLGHGDYRFVAYSLTNASVQDNSGEIFAIRFRGINAALCNHTTIQLDSVFISDQTLNQRLSSPAQSLEVNLQARVVFLNGSDTLQNSLWSIGEKPSYMGDMPIKPSTAQYTYTFSGWDKAIVSVSSIETYTAQFDSVVNKYTITFVDEDGAVLQTSEVEYGQVPAYNGATPTKKATAQYTYAFAGWSPEVVAVTAAATYTATYSSTINSYLITFVNYDGTTLQSGEVKYGVTPAYTGATPIKPATAQYTYTFKGWDKEIAAVVGAETYVAQFDSVVNQYTITVIGENCAITGDGTYDYGTEVTLTVTSNEGYLFVEWSDGVADATRQIIVTKDATYTAIVEKLQTGWENNKQPEEQAQKIFDGSHFYILRGGKRYTMLGAQVE